MYNRARALFAEFVVSALLPGSTVRPDPSSPWDIDWAHPETGGHVRVQVKCSGAYLPKMGPDHVAPPKWGVKPPKSGYDKELGKLEPGHHCDVFVLARHTGQDIESGWTFYVASVAHLAGKNTVTSGFLDSLKLAEGTADSLEDAVLELLNDPLSQ